MKDYNPGVQLTEHFWSGEFQCQCGCGFGLAPGDMDMEVVEGLEKMRVITGQPIYVVRFNPATGDFGQAGSGCRCEARNRAIGGVEGSFHTQGRAADTWGQPVAHLLKAAQQVPAFAEGGIGRYERRMFVHVDNGPRRRWRG